MNQHHAPPPEWASQGLKSTAWQKTRETLNSSKPERFNRSYGGEWTKNLDCALPGRHTRKLYDQLSSSQASILCQLRTGHARLNVFLARIAAAEDSKCECGAASETVQHFLFECPLHEESRSELREVMGNNFGNISLALGGKPKPSTTTTETNQQWQPHMATVKATIRFAAATKRLDYVPPTV
ncbi:hypothetical protein N7461_004755 [Penicillium sp. DV-2018c]|nr:hypothetical protein N7461_004755 [Penicillium sp. DV-2018c]